MSDTLDELPEPDTAILIAVVDKEVHVAYSKNLESKFDDLLDILDTAAMMVAEEQKKKLDPSIKIH